MLNENTTSAVSTQNSNGFQVLPERGEPADNPRYTHILVPTSLAEKDSPALVLGVEMAALHRAKLTVLHVRPPVEKAPSPHWLDAIDRLYQALDQKCDGANQLDLDSDERARSQIKQLLRRKLPEALWNRVETHLECRVGDFTDQVERFVDEQAVDLLIMSNAPTRWWLSALPAPMRQVLRRTRLQVILVGPDTRGGNGVASQAS